MLFLEHSGYGYSKTRCEDVVYWFIEKYLPRHQIDLIINHRGLKRESVDGWANIEGYSFRPREFFIELQSNLPVRGYITTLLHELWHVHQWVKGDLREKRTKRIWRGNDHTNDKYRDQPWEIDARWMEKVLYSQYLTDTH